MRQCNFRRQASCSPSSHIPLRIINLEADDNHELPPTVATAQIQKALSFHRQDTRVLGVGITRTDYLIQFRGEDQAATIRPGIQYATKY
jgi:hypothetical protein